METLKKIRFISATICVSLIIASCSGSQKKSWTELVSEGNQAQKKQDAATAEKKYQEAIAQAETKFGIDDPRTATCLGYLAELYGSQQEWRKAAKVYKRLVATKKKWAPKSEEYARARKEYAFVRKKLKKYGLQEDKDETPYKPPGSQVR